MSTSSGLRVRFAPSPTGYLHVGGARTALFNYLLARQTNGIFILRIEDTDTARNVAGAEQKIMDDLRWLGLHWDEGIGIGGQHGPYFQSQRLDIYNSMVDKLLNAGHAYYAFEKAEELDAMRAEAEARKSAFKYPRPERFPDDADVAKARQEGRPVVVRFKMPAEDVTVHDEVMGDVTVAAAELDDFVIRKADGMPVYHLANVVDDSLMGVNLVMRGQEFLGQTPRHIALQRALGFSTPRYAHLPLIMDMKGRKLSKRDGDVEVHSFRAAGYLPEALVNFIALLGWSPGGDREKMTLNEMVELLSLERVGRTNAKFDREKLLAFNTDWAAALSEQRLAEAYDDYLSVSDSVIGKANVSAPLRRDLLRINKGFRTFADIDHKAGFIFISDEAVVYDPAAVKKVLEKGGFDILRIVLPSLEALEPWTAEALQKLLDDVCAAQAVGMGKVAQPIRVAVSGNTVSPAIYDTLVLLGKAGTLNRIRRALALQE